MNQAAIVLGESVPAKLLALKTHSYVVAETEILYIVCWKKDHEYCAKQRLLLVPPKPKLFVKATSICRDWGSFGA